MAFESMGCDSERFRIEQGPSWNHLKYRKESADHLDALGATQKILPNEPETDYRPPIAMFLLPRL